MVSKADLRILGVRLGGPHPSLPPLGPAWDLERILLRACEAIPGDGRLASVLMSWVNLHHPYVLVEKLARLTRDHRPVWLSALAAKAVHAGSHKWKKLRSRFPQETFLLDPETSRSAIRLKGGIDWLEPLNILVPDGALRIRNRDVLSVEEMVAHHPQYRNRLIYGACWRADVATALDWGAITPTEVCRMMGCSYEPAHRIKRELELAGLVPDRPLEPHEH